MTATATARTATATRTQTRTAGTAARRLIPALLAATVLAIAPVSEAAASIGTGIAKDQLSHGVSQPALDLSTDSDSSDPELTIEPRPELTVQPRPTRTMKPIRPIRPVRPGQTLRPIPPLHTPDDNSSSSTGCDVAENAASCATVVAVPSFTG